MTFRGARAQVVCQGGVPYGYTLAVWSTGALCIGRFGLPTTGEAFLFVLGGSVGYGGLALVVRRQGGSLPTGRPMALWQNFFAIPAIGAAYGLDRAVPVAALNYFVSPLTTTLVYLLGLSWLISRVAGFKELATPCGPARLSKTSSEPGSRSVPEQR